MQIVCAILTTLAVQYWQLDWKRHGEAVLTVASALSTALLAVLSRVEVIWIVYTCDVLYIALYNGVITIATFALRAFQSISCLQFVSFFSLLSRLQCVRYNIARRVSVGVEGHESTALVFGVNTFIALLLQSIFTALVTGNASGCCLFDFLGVRRTSCFRRSRLEHSRSVRCHGRL